MSNAPSENKKYSINYDYFDKDKENADDNQETNLPVLNNHKRVKVNLSGESPLENDEFPVEYLEERVMQIEDVQSISKTLTGTVDEEDRSNNILSHNSSKRVNFESQVEKMLLSCFNIINNNNSLMVYQTVEGYFKRMSDNELAVLIRKNLTEAQDQMVRKQKIDEIIYRLKTNPELQRELDHNGQSGLINFRNGVYDLNQRILLPHSTHYCFMNFIDANYEEFYLHWEPQHYDSLLYSSNFSKFLDDCTGGDELKMRSLQQMVGYIISNHTRAKKMFILVGKPHTGKSVWLSLLQNLIGTNNTTSMTLKQLADNRFMQSRLAYSHLNISPEMSEDTDLKGIEFIKAITGGDLITGDRKGETAIDFVGKTKLVAAGNHMPRASKHDGTNAFIDRLLFITFNNSTPEHKRDRFLLEKLLEERNLIVRWALDGLHELIENNFKFTECNDTIVFKRKYMRELSNFPEFIDDMCILQPYNLELKVHRKTLYEAYKEYCKENGLQALTRAEFWREVEKLNVKSGKFRIDGSNPLMGFKGIALKSISY